MAELPVGSVRRYAGSGIARAAIAPRDVRVVRKLLVLAVLLALAVLLVGACDSSKESSDGKEPRAGSYPLL
jgi:hypothetical protein